LHGTGVQTCALPIYLWRKYQLERWSMKKRKWYKSFKVAASLAILIAAGFTFILSQLPIDQQTISETKEIVKETKPGEKLKTMLPDGTIVYLRSEEHTSELQSRENLVCR